MLVATGLQPGLNAAQLVISDCTKRLLTGTFEKAKKNGAWDGERDRKPDCLLLSVRELNQRTAPDSKRKGIANCV